jgi:ABC-2 type transport system permease protein
MKSVFRINSKRAQRRVLLLLSFVKAPTRALVTKEYKLFARDMIQALQLMVLLGLCVMYLYNFQILRTAGESAPIAAGARIWWSAILVIMNLAVGGLVITTVCMRFVFPSVSLEGQSYWILQVAPVSPLELLKAKFWCWLIPLGTITSVIMASGALAIQAEPRIVAVSAFVSWVFCYGIVGLAVGLGAFFSNFTWDHPAQLTASFGALMYLFLSVILVAGSMVPTSVLVLLRTARSQGMNFPPAQWAVFVILASAFVVYLNFVAHRWAMKLGAQALAASK